jgi:hypothetical protein
VRRFGTALVLGLALSACGPHTLDLNLTIAADCSFSIASGGSLLYEVVVDGADGGQAPRVCASCLPVTAPIGDAKALMTMLRASAPSCQVSPGSAMHVRLTSFPGADCMTPASPAVGRLCGLSGAILAGGGQGDQQSTPQISCAVGCNDITCNPISCQTQGKDCDSVGDGCGTTLFCGMCKPPLRCGGGGTANVCGK